MNASEKAVFSGRINRKLTSVFAALVFLVAVVGGTTLYVAQSVLVAALEVKKESERIDLVDQLHYTAHHIIEAVTMAAVGVSGLAEDQRDANFAEIRRVLRRYETESVLHKDMTVAVWRLLRRIEDAAKDLARSPDPSPSGTPNSQSLQVLNESAEQIQAIAHSLSGMHRSKMEQMVRDSTGKMGVAVGLYGGFVLVGMLLVIGSSVFVTRGIVRPLRSLAARAREVAEGKFDTPVPVTSKDEIGQLSHAFNVMVARIRENDEKIQSLATLEERERIAEEFHDTLAQDLVLLELRLNTMALDFPRETSPSILAELKDIREIAHGAYENVRQTIFGLRTMVSKGLGLIPTLTEYLHEFSDRRNLSVDLRVHNPELIRLSSRAEIQLIHIIHEALSNVFKHSEANAGAVTVNCNGEFATVTVEDDGKGFDLESVRSTFHVGLQTMRERAERVGGKLNIESASGKGTKVIVVLPLSRDADESDSSPAG